MVLFLLVIASLIYWWKFNLQAPQAEAPHVDTPQLATELR
jgi:hypothetical protein